jgi:hypothetical protein
MSSSPLIAGVAIAVMILSCVMLVIALRNPYRCAITRSQQKRVHEKLLAKREEQLRLEAERRNDEERDTTAGSRVWFSRCVKHGKIKHWVLIIDSTKYELRRDRNTGTFIPSVEYWTSEKDKDTMAKRLASLESDYIPIAGDYYLCLIGWTSLSTPELKGICDEVMSQFGGYNLLWNNCQDFLQQFADRIISKKAIDWSWFRENLKTKYRADQKLPETPEQLRTRQAGHTAMQMIGLQSFMAATGATLSAC